MFPNDVNDHNHICGLTKNLKIPYFPSTNKRIVPKSEPVMHPYSDILT